MKKTTTLNLSVKPISSSAFRTTGMHFNKA